MTVADRQALAEFLDVKAALLSRAGLSTGYHNHNFEFAPAGGRTGFEILMEATDPKLVTFEMGAGWSLPPAALLQRYPGRFRLMHVKDIKASTKPNFWLQQDPTEVGSGRLAWAQILPAAYAAGVRDFVEQEPPFPASRLAAIEKSLRYLISL